MKELKPLGYHGVYKQHDREHGLATFYKQAKFEMTSSEAYCFTELLGELSDSEKQFQESNRDNERHAQYTTLKDLQTAQEVVIGWSCNAKPCRGGKISSFFFNQYSNLNFTKSVKNTFLRYKQQSTLTPRH